MAGIHGLLFLGFPVTEIFATALEKNSPEYISLFIKPEDNSLKSNLPPMNRSDSNMTAFLGDKLGLNEIQYNGVRYLGKFVKNEASLTQLELLEANIFSLLKKLVTHFEYRSSDLFLFSVP